MQRFYFAYGSNMSPKQMARRCPGSRAVGPARLEGWRFNITKRGSASIVKRRGECVHGVLWRVSPHHVTTLDHFEGVAVGNYVRRAVVVTLPDGTVRRALTYVGVRHLPGHARVTYMLTAVLPGARAFSLPPDYIASLEAWLPRYHVGEKRRAYIGRKVRRR